MFCITPKGNAMQAPTPITPAGLRAEIARLRVPLYHLAAAIDYHPTRLGMVLNERLPLTPALSERIVKAIIDLGGYFNVA